MLLVSAPASEGYVIEYPESLVYFAGDTSFGSHFSQIRESLARHISRCCLSVHMSHAGFMSPVRLPPEEAVRAHEVLGAKTSIAIHHRTFQLADEGIDTPQRRLMACRRDDSFLTLGNGQSAESNAEYPNAPVPDVTLAYLKAKEAESEEAPGHVNN
jgi:L-ascorbate metabolism protein UlaG (beta-lactamase superfamily)